jgi:2-polyprenyl-3-methyl-5-hydroxy-6-metoxy-1,4-benzoquinol methylase
MAEKEIYCDLCGADEYKFLFNGTDRLHGFDGTFSYVMCRRCGLIYMNPQVCLANIATYYPDNYAPHESRQTNPNRLRKHRKYKINKKFNDHFLYGKLNQNSRLLDVGCGNGKFLYEIKNHMQCEVYGVDISEAAVTAAKTNYGLGVYHGTITEVPFPNCYFDVITAWSYLEHVNNPSEVLGKLFSLLKPGGNCIMSTPSFDSINAKLFRNKWYHLDCPRHLYIYTPKTIIALLKKSGFTFEKIVYEKSSKGLLGSLQYYFYGDNYNGRYSNKIRRSSLLKAVVSPVARIAALVRKADVIVIAAGKAQDKDDKQTL